MFTGIISGMGRIEGIEATPETDSVVLRTSAPEHTENLELGGFYRRERRLPHGHQHHRRHPVPRRHG